MSFRDFLSKLLVPYQEPQPNWPSNVLDLEYAKTFRDWLSSKGSLPAARLEALSLVTTLECLEDRNGYLREFSLRVLMAQDRSSALPHVILRLNDYVQVNRELALQLTIHWLLQIAVESVLEMLPRIHALRRQSRANYQHVLAMVQQRLSEPQNREMVLAGIGHSSAAVRMLCWQLCLQVYDWSDLEKVERAVVSGDAAIARSVEQSIHALADAELQDFFVRRAQLKAMPLRRAVYHCMWRRKLGDMDGLVSLALLDHSYSIRWIARYWSADRPEFLETFYRRVLSDPVSTRVKRYALEGLAQLARAGTVDCCELAFQDASPALRRAALVALCNVVPASRYTYMLRALQDSAAPVRRMGFLISVKTGDYLAYDDLLPLAQAHTTGLEFFVRLLDYAGHIGIWHSMHLASLCRFAAPELQMALHPYMETFLGKWVRKDILGPANHKQWADIYAWLPYETMDSRSPVRFALELEAKRVQPMGR